MVEMGNVQLFQLFFLHSPVIFQRSSLFISQHKDPILEHYMIFRRSSKSRGFVPLA